MLRSALYIFTLLFLSRFPWNDWWPCPARIMQVGNRGILGPLHVGLAVSNSKYSGSHLKAKLVGYDRTFWPWYRGVLF